ncbi:MAG: CPBP family intramembrane metalloprotease [Ruminococcus sp.]|nr:CPBP family intramembrane metalloprotease [Ruminococcus sp.]
MDNSGYIDFGAQQYYQRKQQDKHDIRMLGTVTGAALLCFIILQNLFALVMSLIGLYDKYLSDTMFQTGADIVMTMLFLLLPFALFGKIMQRQSGICESVPLGRPTDKILTILAIPAGLGLCMAANVATSWLVIMIQGFGFRLSSPDVPNAPGVAGFIVSLVRVSVVAAMAEEISLRGYTMQPLRKYGDKFAIIMAACAFGLMHCNLVQAPFALIVGIGLGYICVKTNSLWLGIIIHALNNTISICVSYLLQSDIISEAALNSIYSMIIYGLIIIGIPCLVVFVRHANRVSPEYIGTSSLTFGEKALAYITNPTMLLAIGFMLYCTAQYVSRR